MSISDYIEISKSISISDYIEISKSISISDHIEISKWQLSVNFKNV